MGNIFENGQGVDKSLEKAVYYYYLADMQNNTKGLVFLADYYATGRGIEQSNLEAIKNYKLVADQNDYYAQYSFAKFLLQSKINESHEEKVIHYFKLAIRNKPALNLLSTYENNLAECFENEVGGKKSFLA